MKSMQDGFEKAFSFHEKHSFNVEARTCKYYGLWISELLGLEGADADTYARTVVEANLEEPGFDDVLRYVTADLNRKGLSYTMGDLHEKLEECLIRAQRELSNE